MLKDRSAVKALAAPPENLVQFLAPMYDSQPSVTLVPGNLFISTEQQAHTWCTYIHEDNKNTNKIIIKENNYNYNINIIIIKILNYPVIVTRINHISLFLLYLLKDYDFKFLSSVSLAFVNLR